MEETLNYDSHVWDYRRTNVPTTCKHGIDVTCSTCHGLPDSTLDDTIEPGRTLAWFTPAVEAQEKAQPQYQRRYSWSRSDGTSGVTVVPSWVVDDAPIPADHNPDYPRSWHSQPFNRYGQYIVEVAADDPQEIRVRQAVRDFGLLTRHRDLEYATGIGLDYDAFVWGIVAPEPDHLAVEGADIEVQAPSTRATRPHDRNIDSVRAWRDSR